MLATIQWTDSHGLQDGIKLNRLDVARWFYMHLVSVGQYLCGRFMVFVVHICGFCLRLFCLHDRGLLYLDWVSKVPPVLFQHDPSAAAPTLCAPSATASQTVAPSKHLSHGAFDATIVNQITRATGEDLDPGRAVASPACRNLY